MSSRPVSLNRFGTAQKEVYEDVIRELRNGRKVTHWMWYVFPQIAGLGYSDTAKFFSIQNREEAQAYLDHPILGHQLMECAEIVMSHKDKTAVKIFGDVDAMKLKSSMTLFMSLEGSNGIFQDVIDKYFEGEPDQKTVDILAGM